MEWQEASMTFLLMPNLSQKKKERAGTQIITVFNPNVNQTTSTNMPVAEINIWDVFPLVFLHFIAVRTILLQNCFLSQVKEREKRLWKKVGKQVALTQSVRKGSISMSYFMIICRQRQTWCILLFQSLTTWAPGMVQQDRVDKASSNLMPWTMSHGRSMLTGWWSCNPMLRGLSACPCQKYESFDSYKPHLTHMKTFPKSLTFINTVSSGQ